MDGPVGAGSQRDSQLHGWGGRVQGWLVGEAGSYSRAQTGKVHPMSYTAPLFLAACPALAIGTDEGVHVCGSVWLQGLA